MMAITRCGRVRRRLEALLDGETRAGEALSIEQHLEECARCRGVLASLRRQEALLRELKAEEPGREYWATFLPRVRERIAGTEEAEEGGASIRGRHRPWLSPAWGGVVGGIAVATLAFVIFRANNMPLAPVTPAPERTVVTKAPADEPPEKELPASPPVAQESAERVAPVEPVASPARDVADDLAAQPRQVESGSGAESALGSAGGAAASGAPASPEAVVPLRMRSVEKSLSTAALVAPALDVQARELLDLIASIEWGARGAGRPPDFGKVLPQLEALEPAARHPESSGLPDSLAAAIISALKRVRESERSAPPESLPHHEDRR